MYHVMTIAKLLVAGVATWRFSNLLLQGKSYGGRSRFLSPRPENIFGNRILDCVCWLSVWLSAQTAIWVAAGLSGVLLNWLMVSSLSRFLLPATETCVDGPYSPQAVAEYRTNVTKEDFSCLAVEHRMQANHG